MQIRHESEKAGGTILQTSGGEQTPRDSRSAGALWLSRSKKRQSKARRIIGQEMTGKKRRRDPQRKRAVLHLGVDQPLSEHAQQGQSRDGLAIHSTIRQLTPDNQNTYFHLILKLYLLSKREGKMKKTRFPVLWGDLGASPTSWQKRLRQPAPASRKKA